MHKNLGWLISNTASYSKLQLPLYWLELTSLSISMCRAFQVALMVKNPPVNAGDMRYGFNPWVGKIRWRRKWQPTPVFLPGKSHGQRSLVGYSPWGHKESFCHLLILFIISFAVQRHLSLIGSHLFISVFIFISPWILVPTFFSIVWLRCVCVWSCSVMSDSLRPHGL